MEFSSDELRVFYRVIVIASYQLNRNQVVGPVKRNLGPLQSSEDDDQAATASERAVDPSVKASAVSGPTMIHCTTVNAVSITR